MSAFIVSDRHIDVLVSLAINGPTDRNGGRTVRWIDRAPVWYWGDGKRSSLGDLQNAAALVDDRYPEKEAANQLGRMLLAKNRASVRHRYPHDAEMWEGDPHAYAYTDPRCQITAADGMKAIDCLDYQSCEHPGWKASEAFAFLAALRHSLCCTLPGYEDSPWEWSDDILEARA